MVEESPVQKINSAQVYPDTFEGLYRVGSVMLTAVELAGLMEVVKGPRADRQVAVSLSTAASIPSCKPDILRLRLCRGTNSTAAEDNMFVDREITESEQILASVKQSLQSRGPQRSWQFSEEEGSSLGSVGIKCSPQLLSCLSGKELSRFLEKSGLLEPVIETEPERAAAAGWDMVYASEIDPRPPMPSYEPFP